MSVVTDIAVDSRFESGIHKWGRLTMGLGIVASLAGPIYLFTVEGLWPGWAPIITAMLAISVIAGVSWVVEPATYFPMLGSAGTYQAWLVGNVSNKLLPAAITAQAATNTQPGTRRAELVSVAAISGAVIVHITSLVLFVAIGGTYIISIIPERVNDAFGFVLPAIMGAVFVQLAFALKDVVTTVAALLVGAVVVFVLLPQFPNFVAFALPVVVLLSIVSAVMRAKSRSQNQAEVANTEPA